MGISGQMHGLVMLDEAGNPIRRSIIWCDQRSGQQVDEMLNLLPYEKWLEITANPHCGLDSGKAFVGKET